MSHPRQANSVDEPSRPVGAGPVAIVGMGYVGLPTALALYSTGVATIGIDVAQARLEEIRQGQADLVAADQVRLHRARRDERFQLTGDVGRVAEADVVIVCVPTPLDRYLTPDLRPLEAACRAVVAHARAGQTLILSSTTYVGTTQDLLVKPLADRGLVAGTDVFVAFSPERIDPGNTTHALKDIPRVVGGVTPECTDRAVSVLRRLTSKVHVVSSTEAAELTKLYENSFRAVTLALANEFAEICQTLSLDPIEVTKAAATKPYGFLTTYPGPGVGGHCIPCDPHYLLWQLRKVRHTAPLLQQTMTAIAQRPQQVVDRAVEIFSGAGRGINGARVVVVGASYKPGVRDIRESSALEIIRKLSERGAKVEYHDPLVAEITLSDGRRLSSVPAPRGADWDLVLIHTVHPGQDIDWAWMCPTVYDPTYRFQAGTHRESA